MRRNPGRCWRHLRRSCSLRAPQVAWHLPGARSAAEYPVQRLRRYEELGAEPDEERDERVARASRQEVGNVKAARSAQRRGDALFAQQTLEELGLRLVLRAGDLDEVALGELRLDLMLQSPGAHGELL